MNRPPPELVEALTRLGYRLMRVLFQEAKEAFGRLGLTPLQAEALRLLSERERSPGHLAEEMEMSPSQASALLAHLEDRGFLERAPDPLDRRRVLLRLTEEGRRQAEALKAIWQETFARHLARLNPKELAAFKEILEKLTEAA